MKTILEMFILEQNNSNKLEICEFLFPLIARWIKFEEK